MELKSSIIALNTLCMRKNWLISFSSGARAPSPPCLKRAPDEVSAILGEDGLGASAPIREAMLVGASASTPDRLSPWLVLPSSGGKLVNVWSLEAIIGGGELVRFLGLHRSPFCELHNTIVGLAMVHKQPDTTRL